MSDTGPTDRLPADTRRVVLGFQDAEDHRRRPICRPSPCR